MDWFLYDNGLRHERINITKYRLSYILYLTYFIHPTVIGLKHLVMNEFVNNRNN